MQITSKICFFLYTYFAATEATTGKACPNSTDPIIENRSGEDARLFYNRSIRENVEDFRVYRAYAHSSLFAFMNRYESEGTCSGPLMEICLKEKIEFRKWNQTHLMIKIFDVTVNDSGLYEVSARFRGLQSDEWTMKCLHVIHLEKKGPRSTQNYSATTIKSYGPQSTQDYSTTTTKSSGPQSTQDYSTTTINSSELKVSMAPTSSGGKKRNNFTWITVSVVLGTIFGLLLLALILKGRRIICFRQTLPNDRPLLKPKETVSTAAITNPQFSDQERQDNTLRGEIGVQHCANIEVVDQSSGRTPLLTTLQEEQSHQHERCTAAPYKIPRPVNPSLASDLRGSIELEHLHNDFCSQVDNCSTAPYKAPRNLNSSLPSNLKGESPYTPVQSSNDLEVPCESLKLLEKIGEGEFGQVWKGEAKYVGRTQGWSEVAVKMLKEESSLLDSRDLWYELNLLKKLQAVPHPNVVQLLGCLTKDIFQCEGREFKPPLLILEFVPHGDLLGYLKKSKGETDDFPRKISTEQLYKFASDIARGMAFISAQKFIHRDLAARNILVGEGLRCKITDLGMTRHGGEAQIYVRKSKGVEPLRWMAVESLDREVFTTKSDVWSYGIVLYEIFTLGNYPYSEMKGHEVHKYVSDGHRLERTSRVSLELYDLMLQCWDQAPSRRPTFESIATWMETYTHH